MQLLRRRGKKCVGRRRYGLYIVGHRVRRRLWYERQGRQVGCNEPTSHVQNTLPLGSRRKFAHPRLQGRGTGIHSRILRATSNDQSCRSFETFSKICSKVGGLTLFVRTSHHVQNLTSRSPQGQTLSCGPARNQLTKAGTIVACKDLFYTHPVRRGVIRRNIAKQLEDTRVRLYRLALIHPEVGFC